MRKTEIMIHRSIPTRPWRGRVHSTMVVGIFACLLLVISPEANALSRDKNHGQDIDQEEYRASELPNPVINTIVARNTISETLRLITRQAVKRILRVDWDANTCRAEIVAACVKFGGDAEICEGAVTALGPILLSTGDMKEFIRTGDVKEILRCHDWTQITRQNPGNSGSISDQTD